MSGTLSFAAGQVFIGSSSTGSNTGEVALTEVGTVTFSTLTPPTLTNITITQDIAASATSTPISTPLGTVNVSIESVTIEGVSTAASVTLTTADLPPGITVPPGFTLPQTVVGTTLDVNVLTNVGTITGAVGVYGINGPLALVAVQNLVADGATFNVGAAVLSLGPQATGTVSDSFTPDFTAPCFAAGTRIGTADGAQPVETLTAGQNVRLATGGVAPVRWVGHREVDCTRHPRPADVWPVCLDAGAIGPGQPERPLHLSPDHAIALDGVLVPVRYLVNGASIRQVPCARVRYYHVELPAHALLLAEGLAAESYLDTGNRAAFSNGGAAAVMAHPVFATAAARAVWQERGCLELVLAGPALAARRAALLARAGALGWRETTEPALDVRIDGRVGLLLRRPEGWQVRLPAGARCVALRSRSFVPAEHDATPEGDTRRLGVALHVQRDGAALPDAAFAAGWLAAEGDAMWRWTDGTATLLLPPSARPAQMALTLVAAGARYWLAPRMAGHRRAA